MATNNLPFKAADIVMLFVLLSMARLMRYMLTDEFKESVKYIRAKI